MCPHALLSQARSHIISHLFHSGGWLTYTYNHPCGLHVTVWLWFDNCLKYIVARLCKIIEDDNSTIAYNDFIQSHLA